MKISKDESVIRALAKRPVITRRNFLKGAGGVMVALPFLEGLPERSAWAADAQPVFSLFIVTACGVVPKQFFPTETGPLTTAGLMGMTDKATSALAPYAANLLFLKNVNFPMNSTTGCGHAQGSCQTLTATPSTGGGNSAVSGGISADMVIAKAVNAGGADPLTLYAGNKRNGYIVERISFKGGGAGQVRSADDNPYNLYKKLMGIQPGTPTSGMMDELLKKRKSVNDLVRGELNALLNNSALSSADKQRVMLHAACIRDVENTMGTIGAGCTADGLSKTQLDALSKGFAFKTDGMIEDVAKLHLELVAMAFACNYNRVATLQHGDGTDQTRYKVPSNSSLGWPFHHISHRVQSDSASGSNPTAEKAHAEIDVLRMQTLAHGVEHFKARGLLDKSFIMWTNHVADGPSHSFKNVPHIIAGNGGGYLKQGQYIDAGNVANNKLFNTLITAAVRDKGMTVTNFGQASASGPLTAIQTTS